MLKRAAISLLLAASLGAPASAQLFPGLPGAPKEKPTGIEKPDAPTRPTVPNTKPTTSAKPSAAKPATSFVSELQSLSPEARAFATSKLPAMTPSLRARAATTVAGKPVPLSQIPETWLASASSPAGARLWLGGKGVNLLTGPDVEPMFQVTGGEGADGGVWVQFNAEPGVRHLLVCDLTNPDRWDIVIDAKTRVALTSETATRGIALVPARAAASYQRLLLTVGRPLQTGPNASLMEGLRRCEVTPIRS